jgi:hypothetical protein
VEVIVEFMQGLWVVLGNYGSIAPELISTWWAAQLEKLVGFGEESFAYSIIAIISSILPTSETTTTTVTEVLETFV